MRAEQLGIPGSLGQQLGLSLEGAPSKVFRRQMTWAEVPFELETGKNPLLEEYPANTLELGNYGAGWSQCCGAVGEEVPGWADPAMEPLTLLPSSMITTSLWAYS